MTTITASKTFLVSAYFPLHQEWRELDLFVSGTNRIVLGKKLSKLCPSGTKSRKQILSALKASLDGEVHEIKVSLGLLRCHSF